MRWVWIIVIGLVLLVLEVGAASQLRGLGSGPDLMLLFAVFLSLYGPIEDAPLSGWLLGMAKDSMSAGTFGLYAVLFMVLSFFLSRIRADIFLEYNKSHIVNAALATLLVYTGASLWNWTQGSGILAMVPAVVGVSIWNALLAPLLFGVFFRFSRPLEALRRPR
ncbi:MAG: rod shape-determining protein MreD [Planctomycetes bacterium]|nr:rod shape-determining protein MreD [Planctomycetota bacterium]